MLPARSRSFSVAVCLSPTPEFTINTDPQQLVAVAMSIPRAVEIEAQDGRRLLIPPARPALDPAIACIPSQEKVHAKTAVVTRSTSPC